MKKICIIHHTTALGGGTISFFDLISLLKEDYEITACIPKSSDEIIERINNMGISVYQFSNQPPVFAYYSGSSNIISITSIKDRLCDKKAPLFVKEILALKPDAVIFNSIITSIAGQYFPDNVKKICFVRETLNRNYIDNLYRKWLNNYFSGVCFIASSELQYLNLDIPTKVIPDFCNCKVHTSNNNTKTDDNFYILYLGGLDYIKGPDVLLKSLRYLPHTCHLLCAGNFNLNSLKMRNIVKLLIHPKVLVNRLMIRNILSDPKIRERITFTGFCSDITNLYEQSDVVVFPSKVPHQLRPGIEAGVFSKPIIVSDYEVTKEYFIDGYNALTFKPNNAKQLAECIQKLYFNRTLCKKIGKNNFQATLTMHDPQKIQKELLDFVSELFKS